MLCSLYFSLLPPPTFPLCVAYNVPELEKKPTASVYRPLKGHLSRVREFDTWSCRQAWSCKPSVYTTTPCPHPHSVQIPSTQLIQIHDVLCRNWRLIISPHISNTLPYLKQHVTELCGGGAHMSFTDPLDIHVSMKCVSTQSLVEVQWYSTLNAMMCSNMEWFLHETVTNLVINHLIIHNADIFHVQWVYFPSSYI